MPDEKYIEAFISAYIECALWASTAYGSPHMRDGECCSFLDLNYDELDLDESAVKKIEEECNDFIKGAWPIHAGWSPEQAGHDFFLTRNRHGAGFWDRHIGSGDDKCELRMEGKRLTELSHPYGETYMYVGDDGRVYVD